MSRKYAAATLRVAAHTDTSQWPVSLRLAEVAVITRQSRIGLYKRVKDGTANPPPVTDARGLLLKPYRWHRDTVRQFVEGSTR